MATEQKPTSTEWFEGAADEDVPAPKQLQKPHEGKVTSAWLAIAIAVLIVGFLAESVFLFRANAPEHRRSDVLALSRRFITTLTTYDTASLASWRTAVFAMATGQFHSDFDRLSNNPAFATALSKAGATSAGKIVTLAVSSVNKDSASVLSVTDVTSTNKDLAAPRINRQFIQMTLVHTSSGWKVDFVAVLGTLSV